MAAGQISDKNTRIAVTIPKDLKQEADYIANKEHRSLSNLIVNLIDNYVQLNRQQDRLAIYAKLISSLNDNGGTNK